MRDFRGLKVWEKAHNLVLTIYQKTEPFPKKEIYGLTSQIRRAAISIPANISEGCGKDSVADMNRFFLIAMGSASELEYLLMLSHDLQYLSDTEYQKLHSSLVEVRRMLNSYIQKMKATRNKSKI